MVTNDWCIRFFTWFDLYRLQNFHENTNWTLLHLFSQFRMSRLHEDDDNDLMMDQADADDFVGGQEATFDIKA